MLFRLCFSDLFFFNFWFVLPARAHMNAFFDSKNELVHGKRYLICLNAPRKEIEYEKWTEVLPEVKSCSDGVTVDLTPPKPGRVWIGIDPNKQFQVDIISVLR